MGPKGQITIPKPVREALGLATGDLVETTLTREGALVRPVALTPKTDWKKRFEAAEQAVKEGRTLGPFASAGATMRAVKRYARRARHSD